MSDGLKKTNNGKKMTWWQKRQAKRQEEENQNHHRLLLKYVEYRRKKDLAEIPFGYLDEETWNREKLKHVVEIFNTYPTGALREMNEDRIANDDVQWLQENDPSVLRDRIKELESQLGISH